MWEWFLANGDGLLNQIAVILLGGQATGILTQSATTKYGALIAALLAIAHNIFAPKPTAAAVVANPTAAQSAQANKAAGFMRLSVSVILVALTACAALGLSNTSTDQKLYIAAGTEDSVVKAATAAVQNGTLSSSAGNSVLNAARSMDPIIAAGHAAVSAGDASTASTDLALATGVLTQLQTYVNAAAAKQGK